MFLSSEAISAAEISVVIPAYNEETRLPKTLLDVYKHLSTHYKNFEILVVDDGSSDKTADLVRDFIQAHPNVELITLLRNSGKGSAVRVGMLAAKKQRILFMDSDGAVPISELQKLMSALDAGADIAIASRALQRTKLERRPLLRRICSWGFNLFVTSLVVPGIRDTQCGFKLFSQTAARKVFQSLELRSYGFDVEVLYLAKKADYKVVELAVSWSEKSGSKINPLRAAIPMALSAYSLLLRDFVRSSRALVAGFAGSAKKVQQQDRSI